MPAIPSRTGRRRRPSSAAPIRARPCLLDNFVTADPVLKQVVSHTVEAGLRGNMSRSRAVKTGIVFWNVGAFHTENNDDILTIPSQITGAGLFRECRPHVAARGGGRGQLTRRAGGTSSASYTFIDATFLDAITLSSPNNPLADPRMD